MKKLILRKIVGEVLGIIFVITAFFGVHAGMNMDSQEVMQNCPLSGHVGNVCTMTVSEHILKWQQLFTAVVQSNKFLFAALLLVGFAFMGFSYQFSLFNQLNFQTFRSRAGPPEYKSGFLLRAFGRGVLRKRE